MAFRDRLVHAWNAFTRDERLGPGRVDSEPSYYERGRRSYTTSVNERTTVGAIYTRIAVDCAAQTIRHVRLDNDDRFLEYIKSSLDNCLTTEANIDQSGRALRQDVYHTMLEEGVVAVPGVQMSIDPESSGSFEVGELRAGTIVEWKPSRVKVRCWNGEKGDFQEIWQGKRYTPIVQNPLRAVMNEPNSTLKRLTMKLALLDTADELIASGKLDLIIQLPYAVKSETRRAGANRRRADMEAQLKGSKYGVAWLDATEKVTQLNRPAENNLLAQVEWLTQKVYSELGLTKEIMDGTADEAAMINYYNRTIEPCVAAFVDEIKRKFLTKTARSQGQSVMSFRDPFKNVTIQTLGDTLDKLLRNEVLTSNEGRQSLGFPPAKDPKADQLINSNMPTSDTGVGIPTTPGGEVPPPSPADQVGQGFEEEINSLMQTDISREERFIEAYLSHVYDPVKAHAYYERTKKLKGRKQGTQQKPDSGNTTTAPTRRHRVGALADKAAGDLGSQRSAAVQRLADNAQRKLKKLTEEFRSWVDSHPRATTREKNQKRAEVLRTKDQIVKKFKADVAKISAAADKNPTPKSATTGRRPAN